MSISAPMPAAFLGHGSPMNTLADNRYTQAWAAFGASVPRPRAILMVSAHWYVNATAVTAMPRPRTIHDFYGFPRALFEVDYPAPGLPELAQEVADAVQPDYVGADGESWGLDHGTWSVLVHAFPDADVPVVQLSINAAKPPEWHLAMGAKLAALRRRGVLVMASGNVVHNLQAMDWQAEDLGFDWAQRFNERAIAVATSEPGEAAALASDPGFGRIAPTPEHFLPFLYIAGVAADAGEPLEVLVDGYAYGSLSMTSFTSGARTLPAAPASAADGAPGSSAPPEASNI